MKAADKEKVIFRLTPETKKALQIKVLQDNTSVQELLEDFVTNYIKEEEEMKRTTYKGYIIDTDNLGRQYVYNTASPYSEDSDKIIIGVGYKLADIKKAIDQSLEVGEWVGMDRK